jgi:hypothetical protein
MKYYLQARLLPTVITSVPLGVMVYVMVAPRRQDLEEVFSLLPETLLLAFYTGLVFLSTQIIRLVGIKLFQDIIFKGEMYMPTTSQLLWSDTTIDESIKTNIRQRIKSRFSIDLLTPDEEAGNETRARSLIVTATSQIRNSLRNNRLLLQHNIEYGFWRNLIGASVVAVAVSVGLFLWGAFNNLAWLKSASLTMTILYLVPILFSKPLVNWFGRRYTKVLLEQFLSLAP